MTHKQHHFLAEVDSSWTLFLDRDGVINKKLEADYVKNISEFEFLSGVLESLYFLKDEFYKIIIVTNQQGVGKGIMSMDAVDKVHDYMLYEIQNAGGNIDDIYTAPEQEELGSFYRKPAPGMGFKAKDDYPLIDFKKSIMVGDSESDILFGKRLGMKCILISKNTLRNADTKPDLILESLHDFYLNLKTYKAAY
jgi:histidinol-phosphate phosphatase family protein